MAQLSQGEIIYLIVFGTGGMLSLTAGIFIFISLYQRRMLEEQERRQKQELEFQQQKVLAQIESQELERRRISGDLHDSIGGYVNAIRVNLEFLERMLPMKEETSSAFQETTDVANIAIQEIRRISWQLSPRELEHAGLSKVAAELCERLDGKGSKVLFTESGDPILWKNQNALQTYRIIQELINNALKHSKASRIGVDFQWLPDSLQVKIFDDGIGFQPDQEKQSKGIGWWSIRQRVAQLGADILVNSGKGNGSEIQLSIPVRL